MNVRIIAGVYGGRVVEGSGTDRTHPMSERMRNAIFNSIIDEIPGAQVLDAFAGSGAIGIEALSRGASHATFIEKDRIAQKIIENNLAKLRVSSDRAKLIRGPVSSVIERMDAAQFDLIFADPPYHDPQLSTVKNIFRLLKPNGLMVLSKPGKGEVPTGAEVVVVDNRSYGNAALVFYRKKSA